MFKSAPTPAAAHQAHRTGEHAWLRRLARSITLTGVLALATTGAALANEITLRAVSAFADGSRFSATFEKFIAKVNAEGKDHIRINYLGGGGKVMNPFEVGNAIRTGVVEIAQVPGAFYASLMPEADAMKLIELNMLELRANGGMDLLQELHNRKVNAHYLARTIGYVPFHIYTNKPITGPDLTGQRMRITPVYRAFFQAMGATVVQTAPGEVFTALERRVVDGYGFNPSITEFGWQEVTRYRVDPGFYDGDLGILVNLTVWNKLTPQQRAILERAGGWAEGYAFGSEPANLAEDYRKQREAGIKTIEFEGEVRKRFLELAKTEGWKAVRQQSPETAERMYKLFTRQP